MPEQSTEEQPDLLLAAAEIQAVTNRDMPTELAKAIAALATDAVRDYCGWRVAKTATETITLASRGTRTIFLPSLHIVSIDAVIENGVTVAAGDGYDWDEAGILHRVGRRRWHAGRRTVEVTLTHGHARCPGGIATAIASAVARGAFTPAGGLVSEGALGQTNQYGRTTSGAAVDMAFTPEELLRLDAHRIGASR